jgi:DNA-binding response OmpR family regulator
MRLLLIEDEKISLAHLQGILQREEIKVSEVPLEAFHLTHQAQNQISSNFLHCADLTLNIKTQEVIRDGKEIHLTPREFAFLKYLMVNKNILLSRNQILDVVWEWKSKKEDLRIVDVYMGYLKRKIDRLFGKKLLETRRGFGYRISDRG